MQKRPRLKLRLSKADIFFEVLGWLVLISIWFLTIINYNSLPEIIPVHFNARGEADGFGSKVTLFSLPAVATLLYIGITILNNYPHVFNYPDIITEENALRQYTYATRLIRYLKLAIVFIFGGIAYYTILIANGLKDGLGAWFLPFMLTLIFLPLIFYMLVAVRKDKVS